MTSRGVKTLAQAVRAWMDEPRATAMARSILSLAATNTAVMCSAALPAMGSTMRPRNRRPTPVPSLTSSMDPVKNLPQQHVWGQNSQVEALPANDHDVCWFSVST